ncbi:MAG TPA: class I adenylate-forming enzyme family protein [Chthoniobacterales bacterium]
MKVSDPILSAWQKTLSQRGRGPAVTDEQGAVLRTFQQVEHRSGEILSELNGFEPGAIIAVQIGNHPDWPSITLACLRGHLVILPLDSSINIHDRAEALEVCRVSGLIENAATGDRGVPNGPPAIAVVNRQNVVWGESPPSLLKLTSGTTAAPRAIRFRSKQLMADCTQICDTMGISYQDLNFGVIPISHSYGFSNLLTPLLVRGVAIALSSDRLPRAIIRNLDRSGATVFPGMPVFYQAFAEMTDIPPLTDLRLCISAGAPLPAKVAQQFREKFGLSIHSFYGSSECGGICYDRDGSALEGIAGEPMNGVQLDLIDADANIGRIRVRSAAVGDGYFPEADPNKLGNGMFIPDDLLTLSKDGWKIVGRVSDLINVAGKKVNPAEVEAELLAVPGVREAIVFGRRSAVRHQEVAACVVATPEVSESDLLKACRRRLSGWQVPKRIFMLDQLPVNERGKINRRDLEARFADGS